MHILLFSDSNVRSEFDVADAGINPDTRWYYFDFIVNKSLNNNNISQYYPDFIKIDTNPV